MTTSYLCLSREDLDQDQYPEILIEFIKQASKAGERETLHAAFVSSSGKDGKYDRVMVSADVDNSKGLSGKDEELLLELAQAFAQIHF